MGYLIPNPELTDDYLEAFNAVGTHLQDAADRLGVEIRWIKSDPCGPSIEHLSFFCGAQAFFVQAVDEDSRIEFPGGTLQGLRQKAHGFGGVACWMPLQRSVRGGRFSWRPVKPGWGLVPAGDAGAGAIDPVELGKMEAPVVTAPELHDFAVRVVRGAIEKEGREVVSWNSELIVEPSIWFRGADGKPEWVVVGECRPPETEVRMPKNLQACVQHAVEEGYRGWWAPVVFHAAERIPGQPEILYRGKGAEVDFGGLVPLDF